MAKTAEVTTRWLKQLQFEGSGTGRPAILVDGDSGPNAGRGVQRGSDAGSGLA